MKKSKSGFTKMKAAVRRCVNGWGFDVVRFTQSPKRTLIGLAGWNVRTVIDVGANEGQFARMISAFFPNATLYCFEPLEEPFRRLSDWAQISDTQVQCFQFALGEQEAEFEMHLHEAHTASSSLLAATDTCHRLYPQTRAERDIPVRVATLDGVLGNDLNSIERDILLKLDVQGFEDRVLRGAPQILSECRAVLLEVSIAPLYEEQADFYELARFLYGAGFRYVGNLDQIYAEDGRVVFLDALFTRS